MQTLSIWRPLEALPSTVRVNLYTFQVALHESNLEFHSSIDLSTAVFTDTWWLTTWKSLLVLLGLARLNPALNRRCSRLINIFLKNYLPKYALHCQDVTLHPITISENGLRPPYSALTMKMQQTCAAHNQKKKKKAVSFEQYFSLPVIKPHFKTLSPHDSHVENAAAYNAFKHYCFRAWEIFNKNPISPTHFQLGMLINYNIPPFSPNKIYRWRCSSLRKARLILRSKWTTQFEHCLRITHGLISTNQRDKVTCLFHRGHRGCLL